MASEGTELPSRPQSTLHNDNLANAASPVSSTDARSVRGSQAQATYGTGITDSSNPYLTFMEETFTVSDSGYTDVLRWFDTWQSEASSRTRLPNPIVYKCFDFCPSSADKPQSLNTKILHGPIKQDTFKTPAVNGVLRVIIVETTSGSFSRVMNDAGVHFKLPPCVFAPFTKTRIGDVTSWFLHEMYAEPLIFRVEGLPVVVQQVAFPGSEATDMTCSKSASCYASGAHAMQSSFCLKRNCPAIFCAALLRLKQILDTWSGTPYMLSLGYGSRVSKSM